MAISIRVKNSFGQDFTVNLPVNEGQVFRGVPGNGEYYAFIYKNGTLYNIPKNSFPGKFDSLPSINPGHEAFGLLQGMGQLKIQEKASSSEFIGNQQRSESIQIGQDPQNPNRQRVISSTRGELSPMSRQSSQDRSLTIGQGIQSTADTLRRLSQERGVALTPQFQTAFGKEGSDNQMQQQDNPLAGSPYEEIYNQLKTYLDELKNRGQVLNPNIEITPEKVAEFTKQAETEINPYYSSQLKLARESLLSGIGYRTEDILRKEKELEQKYQTNLRQLGESAAEKGFAQSGLRSQGEQELAAETQSRIEQGRRDLTFDIGNVGRQFAQKYGTAQTTIPSITEAPRVLPGEQKFISSQRQLPLYQLSPETYEGLIGEQEFQRRGTIQQRSSELEQAQRSLNALQQSRQLQL